MAEVTLDFLSHHSDQVQQHLREFFANALREEPGTIVISVHYGSHGWSVVHVSPYSYTTEVRRILYLAGGGDERRTRPRRD
jgi:hypothetical protein